MVDRRRDESREGRKAYSTVIFSEGEVLSADPDAVLPRSEAAHLRADAAKGCAIHWTGRGEEAADEKEFNTGIGYREKETDLCGGEAWRVLPQYRGGWPCPEPEKRLARPETRRPVSWRPIGRVPPPCPRANSTRPRSRGSSTAPGDGQERERSEGSGAKKKSHVFLAIGDALDLLKGNFLHGREFSFLPIDRQHRVLRWMNEWRVHSKERRKRTSAGLRTIQRLAEAFSAFLWRWRCPAFSSLICASSCRRKEEQKRKRMNKLRRREYNRRQRK